MIQVVHIKDVKFLFKITHGHGDWLVFLNDNFYDRFILKQDAEKLAEDLTRYFS